MKGLYDVARHLVWLTQFGLSVVVPPTALHCRFGLAAASVHIGRLGRSCRRCGSGCWPRVSCLRCSLQALDRQGRPAKKDGRKNISYIL